MSNKNQLTLLLISSLIIFVVFLITRLPFFLYYPVPDITPDYSSYYVLVDQMTHHQIPHFDVRTPGFPFFLYVIFLFTYQIFAVVAAQNILTLVAALFFVYSVFRTYRKLTFFTSVALAAFISSSLHISMDTTPLTESLYVNLLLLTFAFFILAVRLKKPIYFILCSVFIGLSIYVRPTAVLFLPICLITFLFLLRNKFNIKCIIGFMIPMPVLVVALMANNYFTINSFALNNFGEITMTLTTSTFLDTDRAYPQKLNYAIEKVKSRVSYEDRDILLNSWDLVKLDRAFSTLKYWDNSLVFGPLHEALKDLPDKQQRYWYRRISKDAIAKYPAVYTKLFLVNMARYHWLYMKYDTDFYDEVAQRYKFLYIDKGYMSAPTDELKRGMLREYYDPRPLKFFEVKTADNGQVSVACKQTLLKEIHDNFRLKIQQPIFRKSFWSVIMFAVFLLSFFVLLSSKFTHTGAFILFVMVSAAVLSGLITSLSNFTLIRYSYTLEFVNYLSLALLPMLMMKGQEKQTHEKDIIC
ncbi:MAG: hypothetical protein V2A72_06255 [Candidatus Omnitrophota bacterium]